MKFRIQHIHDERVTREWEAEGPESAMAHVSFAMGAMDEGDSVIVNLGEPADRGYLPEETGVQD